MRDLVLTQRERTQRERLEVAESKESVRIKMCPRCKILGTFKDTFLKRSAAVWNLKTLPESWFHL